MPAAPAPGTVRAPGTRTAATFEGRAAKNIARWCGPVRVGLSQNGQNYAKATKAGRTSERIYLTKHVDGVGIHPDWGVAVAIQYHECAHLLQYRAYAYDFPKMRQAMDKTFGTRGNTDGGTEHMADCMADVMGATRFSMRTSATGETTAWTVGYGTSCTEAHYSAARKLVAGKRA